MSTVTMLTDVITHAFSTRVGKCSTKALVVRFNRTIDYDKEDGYRYLELVIHAPMNYVAVLARETWNVIPLEDLEDTDDGDTVVKRGKDYQKGASEWKLLSYHDSCWRDDGVKKFLFDNEAVILGWNRTFGDQLFEVIEVSKIDGQPAEYTMTFEAWLSEFADRMDIDVEDIVPENLEKCRNAYKMGKSPEAFARRIMKDD